MIHYKAILCEIKYIFDIKDYCYHMKPDGNINGLWELRGYSEADYTGDDITQKSLTGYIIIINGPVIAYLLRSHKTVTLSVIEDKY